MRKSGSGLKKERYMNFYISHFILVTKTFSIHQPEMPQGNGI